MKTTIYRNHLEVYFPVKRDNADRRKKSAFAVFSYLTREGTEYRRSFTAPINTPETDFWKIAPETLEI